jgi:hypothetical protein
VARLRTNYADGLRLLAAASGLVLLIACANVANLLLAQGTALRSQTVMRVALGAPRSRLIRQALVEGLMLGLLGGAAGLAVSYAGTQVILSIAFRGARYVPIDTAPSLPVRSPRYSHERNIRLRTRMDRLKSRRWRGFPRFAARHSSRFKHAAEISNRSASRALARTACRCGFALGKSA